MSRLEKFINNNRGEFDDMVPSEMVWQKVEAGISKKTAKLIPLGHVVKWTTVAAVLLIVAAIAFMTFNKNNLIEASTPSSVDPVAANTMTPVVEELPEMNQFAKMIAVKQEELKLLSREQPALYQKFTKDITQLDSSYNTLKNKLSVTPNREILIEAMIQNLELQINVLNQQLNIIHKIKQSKNYSHEKNKTFT